MQMSDFETEYEVTRVRGYLDVNQSKSLQQY